MRRVTTLLSGVDVTGGGINRLYFAEGVGTSSDCTTAVRNFWTALNSVMASATVWQVLPTVETIDPVTGQITQVASASGFNGAGTNGSSALPNQVQGLIQWRSGVYVGGRELRGRTFVPGPTTAASTAGLPNAAYLTALDTAGDALIADANTALLIWSRAHGQEVTASVSTPWSKFAVLRSRRD